MDLIFILEKDGMTHEFEFTRDKTIPADKQVEDAIAYISAKHPGYIHPFKVNYRTRCWYVFSDDISLREISNATGHTYHTLRTWVTSIRDDDQKYTRLNISYAEFMEPSFQAKVQGTHKYKTKPTILDDPEKEGLIRKYFADNLSYVNVAKALGVSVNTLRSYVKKHMPELVSDNKNKNQGR